MELTFEEFVLEDCLSQVADVVLPLAESKEITVDQRIDKAIGLITADEQRLRQILYNLLSNAIKFTPEKGQVDVTAERRKDSSIYVTVKDTGIGIKPEHQGMIFSEFRQVEESNERRYEGTGLGLALTRRLIELHGGEIGFESEVGKGSTFYFEIPQKQF